MCIIMVKKLKHLKTLNTLVEYQEYVECGHDDIYSDNILWYLGDHILPKLGTSIRTYKFIGPPIKLFPHYAFLSLGTPT
jgi:hypothetical protein